MQMLLSSKLCNSSGTSEGRSSLPWGWGWGASPGAAPPSTAGTADPQDSVDLECPISGLAPERGCVYEGKGEKQRIFWKRRSFPVLPALEKEDFPGTYTITCYVHVIVDMNLSVGPEFNTNT